VDDCLKIATIRTGNKIIFILTSICLFSISIAFSQDQLAKPTIQSALVALSKSNFEQAYVQFTELSAIHPRDPLYKYYRGVSLVKLERDPARASTLLKEAQLGSSAIKTVPSDATFYFGRAQQMSGNFKDAIKTYNLYTEQVGKKTAKEYLTPQFIQQCNEKKGAIVASEPAKAEIVKKDSVSPVKNEEVRYAEKIVKSNPDTTVSKEKAPSGIFEEKMNEALNYQFRADSLTKLSEVYRKQLDNVPVAERGALKNKITEIEQFAIINQNLANERIVSAVDSSKLLTGKEIIQEKIIKSDSLISDNEKKQVFIKNGSDVRKDTIATKKEDMIPGKVVQEANNKLINDTVNQVAIKEKTGITQPKPIELYSIFEIVAKQVYPPEEKVPVNPEIPAGLIYRIQVAVFRNPVSPSYFKGITPVYGFKNEGSEVAAYYGGMFRRSADASKALVKVKAAGFKDAFVVALLDKKIVSTERAGILEKEWGNKPLSRVDVAKTPETQRDTIPPTLIFRVEVTKSQKSLNTEQLDNIKRLAGNRGLDIIINASGQNIYLIGKFLTFESAAEYADLLTRNGQKDAKVAAYLGRREIPVETAKQLFEKY
jgi:hypothetical protein